MLSKRSIFRDILANPEAHKFLLNSLAVGEADSAKGLDRVAELMPEPATKKRVLIHHAEEQKHGRLFGDRLRRSGAEPTALPPELDYENALQATGFGLPMDRLKDDAPFTPDDEIKFFCGARINEERAVREMRNLIPELKSDADTYAVLDEILRDEYGHLAYSAFELARLAKAGHEARIRATMVAYRKKEAKVHGDLSIAFMERLTKILGYPAPVRFLMRAALRVTSWWERLTASGDFDAAALIGDVKPIGD